MGKTLHFDVLKRHIDAGEKENGDRCPVALAIQEAGHECSVGQDLVIDGIKFKWTKELYNFIGDFDLGYGGEPFAFYLDREDMVPGQDVEEEEETE